MPYTMEEEAVVRGLLRLYLERDSVDQVVRERYRTFQQDLKQGTLCRSDYQWAEMALRFLKPYWKHSFWQEKNKILKAVAGVSPAAAFFHEKGGTRK